MQIRIRPQGSPVTPTLEQHIEQHLHLALARFNGDVKSVTVTVSMDERAALTCTLTVRTTWGRPITIRETQPDILAATTRAAQRAGRAVDRLSAVGSPAR